MTDRTVATPTRLADRLAAFVAGHLEELVARHAPEFRLPRVFAGHRVASDVPADLAFTLGHLADAGVERIGGMPVPDAIVAALDQVDGPSTHSFFSYRVAETLARFGPWTENRLLDRFDAGGRANLAEACDSSSFLPLLDGVLPANYAAVIARCELGRLTLGLLADRAVLDDLVGRLNTMLDANPHGYLDDSGTGRGRYDIYTPDVYLFLEPLAARLGPRWERGARNVVDLVGRVCAGNGAAIPWGRSSGALAGALTIELTALALAHDLTDERRRWLGLGVRALDEFDGWFHGGVITAHQHRSPYEYRGPFRRLQMTLDVLGKLAYAAATLRRVADDAGAADTEPFRPRDEWVPFDDRAGVWSYRSNDLAFVLPLVDGTVSDYLAAPRNPGLFEVPVDSELATFVPVAYDAVHRYAPAGVPSHVETGPASCTVAHDGLPAMRREEARGEVPLPLDASRRARYRVDGRTLHVEEHLRFARAPDALALTIPEVADRPLRVSFTADAPHRVDRIAVDGLKEWRSYWSLLSAVHQLDVEPRTEVTLRWSVEPLLRVALTSYEHHYIRTIYDPLAGRVHDVAYTDPGAPVDQLHVHWPEWSFLVPDGLAGHERVIAALRRHDVRIVWTQHNLTPHFKQPEIYDPVYSAWAQATDAAIHHTHWGREQVLDRYPFRDDCIHAVIPHPHFGALVSGPLPSRAEAEERLGLPSCGIRLGIVGAPRHEKAVAGFARAFTACRRDDVQLAVWSLRTGEVLPDDPRIVAAPYDMVDRATYDLRLAACDALVMPFPEHTMLATGTVADAVAHGLPVLASDWPFLTEYLGDAAIVYGPTTDDATACLDALDAATLARAAVASRTLQAAYAPEAIAAATYELLTRVGSGHL